MSKPRKQRTKPERPPELPDEREDEEPGDDEVELRAQEEIANALDSMPEGARADIWRFIEKGEREYIDTVPAADYSPALVRSYGGGRYIIFFLAPGQKGGWRGAGTKKLNIDKNVRPTNPALAPAGAAAAGSSSAVDELVRQMRVQAELAQAQLKSTVDNATMLQTMQTAVMKSILDARPEPVKGPDTVDVIVKLSAALAPILSPLFARVLSPPAGGLTGKDMLDLGRELAGRGGGVKETLSLLRESKELLETGAGATDGGGGWSRVLERAVDLGTKILERQAPTREPTAGATLPGDQGALTPGVPDVPSTAHPFFKELAPGMPELLEHARAGHAAATYAGLLFDKVPPSHREPLLELLEAKDVLDQLVAAFPQAGAFRAWFAQVIDDLAGRLEDAIAPPK